MATQDSAQLDLLASPVRSSLRVRFSSGEWSALAVGFARSLPPICFRFFFLSFIKTNGPAPRGNFSAASLSGAAVRSASKSDALAQSVPSGEEAHGLSAVAGYGALASSLGFSL